MVRRAQIYHQNSFFVATFPGVSKKMGLKSVSINSNERKAKGKPALDIKGRPGKKPGRMTDLPVVKASLQKISEFSSKSKTPPRVSEPSQTQVCKHLLYTPRWNIRKFTLLLFTSYRMPLIDYTSKARLRWRTFVQKTSVASPTWLKSWQSTSASHTHLSYFTHWLCNMCTSEFTLLEKHGYWSTKGHQL